jgi:hypothetical protein
MGYPRHLLLAFGGDLTGSSETGEIWQCGIRCAPAAGSAHDYGDEDAILAALQGPFKTWFQLAANLIRNDCNLKYLKLNEIAPDGSYADPTATHEYDYATPGVGGAAASLPAVISLVWSWTTARHRGIASKGRIYPPNVVTVTSAGMRVSTATQNSHVTAAKNLLNVLSRPNGVDFELAPLVVSKGANGGAGVGAAEDITGVRVGDVVDIQRRRKNALKETYVAAVWP